MEQNWHSVFQTLIFLLLSWLGTGLTQQLKLLFKIQDRGAIVITALVAAIFAVGEMFLSQVIGLGDFTIDKFPATFAGIFALASVYYAWFKGSDGFLGRGGVLKNQ